MKTRIKLLLVSIGYLVFGAALHSGVYSGIGGGISTNQSIRSFGSGFDGGGTALTSGKTTYLTVPFACAISAWNITADTGTVSFDVWKVATGTAIHSTTLSTFTTTTVSANDILGINLEAVSGATEVSLVIACNATS